MTQSAPLPDLTADQHDRLNRQMAFLREADKLKGILRASRLLDNSRHENSAEHSWHIMLYACVLAEHAGDGVDATRVMQMLLIHDIVEIDAGDAPIHGHVDHAAMALKEAAAADRLFNLLPDDQARDFRALWDEFEAAQTPDAQFAKAIDRTQTPVGNLHSGGGTWTEYDVTMDQMDTRVGVPIQRGAPVIWAWLRPLLVSFFANR
ncbi:HD domain-containing protein [Pseudosulfitobacter koreensis]|uniref:HD domain-containing protein n=1 Tax=Pseudosulfitobacter koreensis TaxID=2968472 RepID=A0ABT1Z245_9RHOB|nr:HD domain-containing protein [Pseudosulfitobacter koreense]MCR8827181.1 HD domain-containing protein [Pseudosulfitobacter koreense]